MGPDESNKFGVGVAKKLGADETILITVIANERMARFANSSITVTKNEILYSFNKPDEFILAMVEFEDDTTDRIHYLRQAFKREPDFGVTSVNYDLDKLLAQAKEPA